MTPTSSARPKPSEDIKAAQAAPTRAVADASFATTLANGLHILASMPSDGSGLSNAVLARKLGLSRPTVSRLCATLIELGYLVKGRQGRYRSGPGVLTLAHPMLAGLRIRQQARSRMRDFAEHAQGNVSMTVLDGLFAVNVETCRIFERESFVADVGMKVPLERSSSGRALLSMLPRGECERVLHAIAKARPDDWERLAEEVRQEIDRGQKDGFCVSLGGFDPGIFAVSGPIGRTADGHYLAVNCGMPAYRTSAAELHQHWGPRVAALAKSLCTLDPDMTSPEELLKTAK
ncbi:MAG: IclR family transcriptional regulator [Burkholderiaceae bacterium]|nr:IclR family transcriptional regulator [Burkholderiaceae bacterium]